MDENCGRNTVSFFIGISYFATLIRYLCIVTSVCAGCIITQWKAKTQVGSHTLWQVTCLTTTQLLESTPMISTSPNFLRQLKTTTKNISSSFSLSRETQTPIVHVPNASQTFYFKASEAPLRPSQQL